MEGGAQENFIFCYVFTTVRWADTSLWIRAVSASGIEPFPSVLCHLL